MAGFDNDVVYANNADFSVSGAGGGSESNGLQTNGQLWIGRTAVNVGGTHVSVGNLTSPDASVTIGYSAPNITLSAGTSMGTVQELTPDLDFDGTVATPVEPQAGNINFLSYNPSFATVTNVLNSTGTAIGNMQVEHRAWLTGLVVDPSAALGTRGTFQTIAAALTAAVSGQTIFIRTGSYTENLTLKAGVNLSSFTGDGMTPNVTIIGTCTATFAGTCTISGIRLQTNSSFFLTVSGSAATIVNLVNCYLNCTNNTGISYTSSSASSLIRAFYCLGDLTTTGIAYAAASGAGRIRIEYCRLDNTGGATTNTTVSAGAFTVEWSTFKNAITTSATGQIGFLGVTMELADFTAITHGGSAESSARFCRFSTGTASAISVSTGSTLVCFNTQLISSNTNVITGIGTLNFCNNSFGGSSSTINTTTQVPFIGSNNAVKVTAPGAYPYTVLPQDQVVVVDTSSARTINLTASPVTGQYVRIKDNVGSAAANNITISPAAGNIDGAASATINVAYGSIDLVRTGSEWSIF